MGVLSEANRLVAKRRSKEIDYTVPVALFEQAWREDRLVGFSMGIGRAIFVEYAERKGADLPPPLPE